ncbi:IclR family transcriptional regulator [Rhodococcus sp. ABRD24]|uniref:IclR family transcriptional regulator n=1 Tax=Rhodococcus sp. ABRD24 TaxID=2507582 RepID=UPI00103ED963|nr:IclR family transcriptional regulator [Rhodococcus sp. ABRD24]QBJ96928.1 IclR family transcriptional regulator [Rhodococcus sp. ABRD24]
MENQHGKQQNSFARGLDVLISIAQHGQTTVAEIAEELGIPQSTVYRYIRSLRDRALIEESRGTYIPGWRLMDIAGHHLINTRLVTAGTERLRHLTDQTSETSVLAIRAGSQGICLRQVASPNPHRHEFRVNELLPLNAGAGQRILLAFAPRPILDIVLARMAPHTANTPSAEQLTQLIETTRRNGFTVSRGEFRTGAVAISVPVFAGGEIACSLTLAGPSERCSSDRWLRRSLSLLRDAADSLGDVLVE